MKGGSLTRRRTQMDVTLLEPADAARLLNLSPAMVRVLAQQGVLRVAVTTPRGLRLFAPHHARGRASRRGCAMKPTRAPRPWARRRAARLRPRRYVINRIRTALLDETNPWRMIHVLDGLYFDFDAPTQALLQQRFFDLVA